MKKIALIFFICISILTYSWWQLENAPMKEPVYIAVIGPMGIENGKSMRNGVKLYVDQVNARGGIDGRRVKILFRNDENNSKKAEDIAREISSDDRVLIVIGHYYSETSKAAGKIYKKNQIPAVTASATAEEVILDNKWYFRTIPGNDMEARFVAHYIKKGLKSNSVGIIFTKDPYGKSLAATFEKVAVELGMQLDEKWKWEWDKDKPSDEQLNIIRKQLAEQDTPGVLYCATHAAEGVEIITALKDSEISDRKYNIIASYALARSFFDKLEAYPKEWSSAGYYSDGIYFVTPFMNALGGVQAFEFASRYREKYDKKQDVVSISYYDAVRVAVEAARKIGIQGKGYIREDRGKLRDTLAAFYNAQNAVKGAAGLIWFAKEGGVKKEYAVGIWRGQAELPAAVQYAQQSRPVNNILHDVLDDQAILIDDLVMSSTRVVSVGVQNFSVTDIDPDSSEFSASFQLRFSSSSRLNNEILSENMLSPLEFENAVIPVILSNPVTEKKTDGRTVTTFQVQARFKADFNVTSFPFNKDQKLFIRFRHAQQSYEHLIYIPEVESVALDSIPDSWFSFNAFLYQDITSKKTPLGNPEYFHSDYSLDYSRFNIEFIVEKKNSFMILFYRTLPLLLAGIGLFLIFCIPPEHLNQRLLSIVALLSLLVVFHLKQHADLPVGHFTNIDYSYYLLYLFIILSVACPRLLGCGDKHHSDS